jgi:hypothetical protein
MGMWYVDDDDEELAAVTTAADWRKAERDEKIGSSRCSGSDNNCDRDGSTVFFFCLILFSSEVMM